MLSRFLLNCSLALPTLGRAFSSLFSADMVYRLLIAFIASYAVLIVEAFSHYVYNNNGRRWSAVSSILHNVETNTPKMVMQSTSSKVPSGENYSTLTLLEHIHLLNTNVHKQSAKNTSDDSNDSKMIDFFINTLGFGMDPKSVDSLLSNKGVVFVNAGPSQLHLNDDTDYCQKLDELRQQKEISSILTSSSSSSSSSSSDNKHVFEIGLRYNSLEELKKELAKSEVCSFDVSSLGDGREIIRITDAYDRVFVAREVVMDSNDGSNQDDPTISSICQQKVICSNSEQDSVPTEIMEKYGIETTACRGMDFLEFFVYVTKVDAGSTVEKIAQFYDFFFDAPTSVVNDERSNIAIIGFGKIDDNGRAEQSLLFREVVVDDPQRHQAVNSDDLGTGHHIAIYVGNCVEDYEVAASNCVDGGLLWVNPQFEDRVLDVDSAMECKQFRFKNIVDIETGEALYVLEHEIRSISHPLFPGGN